MSNKYTLATITTDIIKSLTYQQTLDLFKDIDNKDYNNSDIREFCYALFFCENDLVASNYQIEELIKNKGIKNIGHIFIEGGYEIMTASGVYEFQHNNTNHVCSKKTFLFASSNSGNNILFYIYNSHK